MLYPERSSDWIEIIKKHKTFSGLETTYILTPQAHEKYHSVMHDLVPKTFAEFSEGELEVWTPNEEVEE